MKRNIQILKDLDHISRAAADIWVSSAARATAERGRFLVALSGGNTPAGLHKLLAASPARDQVDWRATHVFWGDERCVSKDDPANSYSQARQDLLAHVPIPDENVHRIASDPSAGSGQRLEPEAAARDYARVLSDFAPRDEAGSSLEWPRFDLFVLGMGDDGHTASLFPGSPVEMTAPALAVTAHYQDRPAQRVTLTPRVINAARKVLFLVSGESKAETLAKVLFGDYHPENLPAQRIKPADGEVIWLVDAAAASRLGK